VVTAIVNATAFSRLRTINVKHLCFYYCSTLDENMGIVTPHIFILAGASVMKLLACTNTLH
jgi:hypothetical protein